MEKILKYQTKPHNNHFLEKLREQSKKDYNSFVARKEEEDEMIHFKIIDELKRM